MSKPIYQPGTESKISGVRSRTSNLERRPAPPSAAGGGFPTLYHPSLVGIDNSGPPMLHWSDVYLDANTRTNFQVVNGNPDTAGNWSDLAYICFGPIWCGPQNSIWRVTGLFSYGPDHGKVEIGVATFSAMPETQDITARTYTLISTVDCYNAAATKNHAQSWPFKVAGADGVTTTGVTSNSGIAVMLAGTGYWAVRLKVNGKNASSSDYRASIADIEIKRVDVSWF